MNTTGLIDPSALPGGHVWHERYFIHYGLGSGGMSQVYLAEDREKIRPCAVKIFAPPGKEPQAVEEGRFRREVEVLKSLDHKHLMKIYDAGSVGGVDYYAMEYLSGGSLLERLKQEGPLPPLQALELTSKLASAVQHLHHRRMLHRDIKPGNVLFSGDGEPVLTDFGLVRDLEAERRITQKDLVLGTAAYMSPERLTQEVEADERSDIYSLGVLLYISLAGALPFVHDDLVAMHRSMMAGYPPPLLYQKQIPWSSWLVCERALRYSPDQRYPTCDAFQAALMREIQALETRPHLIFVDKDPMVEQVLMPHLEATGLQCTVIRDSLKSLENAFLHPPSLLAINDELPHFERKWLSQEYSYHEGLRQVPLVLYRSAWEPEDEAEVKALGAHTLTKPFSIRKCGSWLREQAQRHQQLARHFRALEPGEQIAGGRFEVLHQLRQSRMSAIYQVYDGQEDARHLLKTVSPGATEHVLSLARLCNEIRALQKVAHAHIIDVLSMGYHGALPYFVMPHVEGGTLLQQLLRRGRFGLFQGLRVAHMLAEAVDKVHHASLVHGSLHGKHVLFDAKGDPILTGFGDAIHQAEPPLPDDPYKDEPIIPSKTTDLENLLFLAFTVLSGKKLSGDPTQAIGALPELARPVFAQAWHINPERRFRYVGEFSRALRELLVQLVPALPPPLPPQ